MELKEKAMHVRELQTAKEIFIIMSVCTKMPYVYCDPDSYDDQVLLYLTEADANKQVNEFKQSEIPTVVLKLENKQFLPFFANLYLIGVNGIAVNHGTEHAWSLQLNDIVRRQEDNNKDENKKLVENPEFQLTALYLMQEARRKKEIAKSEEFKELEEEMVAHLKKGTYIVAVQETEDKEKKNLPILKLPNGEVYQPIFTDISEFMKFAKGKQLKPAVVPFSKLGAVVVKEAKGIVVNPLGVNLMLNKGQL